MIRIMKLLFSPLLECQQSCDSPPLPFRSHPIPPKIKPSLAPTFPARPNLLPLAPKHMAKHTRSPSREAGGVSVSSRPVPSPPGAKIHQPTVRSSSRPHRLLLPSLRFLFVSSSSSDSRPPCSEPFPVRNRSKRSGVLSSRLHGRPKRANARKQHRTHARTTDPTPTGPRNRDQSGGDVVFVRGERSTRKQRGLPDDDHGSAGTIDGRVIFVRYRRRLFGDDGFIPSSPPSRPENQCPSMPFNVVSNVPSSVACRVAGG
ncbi:hypothetical protein B0T18DRAFT_186959 [Schizothecium vesticola]|uniref:Uncharacterized protein n=1 Tax=Schizothecium vesticola TaxID=314040 RepID=A0AA40K2T0_9PEZI|nr:hypothetical protein B0T18DRAFT_186959 [Schizothecium vesticola]